NRAEDVDVDVVRAQAVPAADHVVEAAFALLVDAVRVVQLARPVDAQADQVVVLLEESGPLVVDERAVGLHRVQDAPMVRLAVLVGQRDRTLVEVQSAQHWLAALPGDIDLRTGRRRHQLSDVGLQRRVAHQRTLALAIQVLLGEEEAVFTAQIACRAGGLGEEVVVGDTRLHTPYFLPTYRREAPFVTRIPIDFSRYLWRVFARPDRASTCVVALDRVCWNLARLP